MTDGMMRRAVVEDAAMLAVLYAAAFATPWDAKAFSDFLAQPACDAFIVATPQPAGFILVRTVADECEVITLAVDPKQRGRGLAAQLMATALTHVAQRGATSCHLEVASDNAAALALYRKFRFEQSGLRREYYRRGEKTADAITMKRVLDPA